MLYLFLFYVTINVSFAQSQEEYECDSNFEACGSPEQTGGEGNGGRSVLVQATDLRDTSQEGDDYDGDGIEDNVDNCMRDENPFQLDTDGDGIGDMCDNCLRVYNPEQLDSNNNGRGNLCDSYEEHDAYVYISPCPDLGMYEYCGSDQGVGLLEDDFILIEKSTDVGIDDEMFIKQKNGCNSFTSLTPVRNLIIFLTALVFIRRRN